MLETYFATPFPKPGPEWLAAPDERTPGFFPAYARVSLAIQILLRERIPAYYFADPRAFDNTKTAYPMLLYRASQPYRGKMRTDLTYDVLNPKTLAGFFRSVRPALPGVLEGVKGCLLASDSPELAAQYEPARANKIVDSVQALAKSRKCLYLLIRAESGLITTLIDLAGLGILPVRQQGRRIAQFQKKWRYQLRRMYPGTNLTWLAHELLETATQALAQIEPVGAQPEELVSVEDESPILQTQDCGV